MNLQILFTILVLYTKETISIPHCTECMRPNEIFAERSCDKSCKDLNKECDFNPLEGCYCKDGYARDVTDTCVRIEDCDLRKHGFCNSEEEYRCDNFCNNECAFLSCPKFNACYTGCYCKSGYKRNSNGICIPKDKCERCIQS